MEIPCVRVLVVGDSGVGKTSLLRALCRVPSPAAEPPPSAATWTMGCDVHVLLHQYRDASTGAEREVYVEFVDVGGHRRYELSRAVFYHDVHGVMFVHDLSNTKSYDHLRAWSAEIAHTQRTKGCVVPPAYDDRRQTLQGGDFPSLRALPKLVIGNKKDLLARGGRTAKRATQAPEFRTVESVETSAEPLSMEPRDALAAFLQRTIAFANRSATSSGSATSRSSLGLRQTKNKHAESETNATGLSALAAALPPLSTGSSASRSRWW